MDEYQLYSGLMCNSAGTGLEIGLFMDNECTLYTPKLSFAQIMQDADKTYYNMISDVVEFTFTNSGIECYNPEVQWYNEVDYYYEQMEKAQNGEEEEEEEQQNDDNYVIYDWYTYELTEQQKDEIGAVCAVYTGMIAAANSESDNNGGYSTYKPHTTYNPEHENLFNYDTGSGKANGGKIFGWILLVVVVGGGAAAFFMQKQAGGDKKKPLIAETEGT